MASDYLAKYVLIGFYAQEQDAGSKAERDQFSEAVFNRFNHHIVEIAEQDGVELSDESRTIIAMLATMAPGGPARTKASNAVAAYREYRGL